MKILGIETSCDETGAAVVCDGTKIFSNVVATSLSLHQKTGGIIPEIAAREQIKSIVPVIEESLFLSKVKPVDLDAISVTIGPGLIGSLLVGVETAKTLALVWNKPLIPVNHLWGHIYSVWLQSANSNQTTVNEKAEVSSRPAVVFPLIALIASGGHTDLVLLKDHAAPANALPVRIGSVESVPDGRKHGGRGKIKWLGGTLDDAAGEAFDKVGRFLGLPYPAGPEMEKLAERGDSSRYTFPRPMIKEKNFDFSFSGLKTAVVNTVKKMEEEKPLSQTSISNLASSFQQAVIDVLVKKTLRAAQKYNVENIVVGGGVAANSALRTQLSEASKNFGIRTTFAQKQYCGDNAAMIASAAYFNYKPKSITQIQANPSLHF